MSSSNKTEYLSLNSWLPNDKPKRIDFNADNLAVDTAIKNHFENADIHTTAQDKNRWNNPIYIGVYFGDGDIRRTINVNCGFVPQAAIVFAADKSISRMNFSQGKKYNYVGFATDIGSTMGMTLVENSSSFIVTQAVVPQQESEFNCLNEIGEAYIYILFR